MATIDGVAMPAAKIVMETAPPCTAGWVPWVLDVVLWVLEAGGPKIYTREVPVSLNEGLAVTFKRRTLTTRLAEKLLCVKLLGICRAIVDTMPRPGESCTGRPVAVLVWEPGGSAGAVRVSLISVTFPSAGQPVLITKTSNITLPPG